MTPDLNELRQRQEEREACESDREELKYALRQLWEAEADLHSLIDAYERQHKAGRMIFHALGSLPQALAAWVNATDGK